MSRRVAVLALVLAGCGVPTQEEPQLARDRDVPFNLLATTTTTTATTTAGPTTTATTSPR